ncbi:hypothetical protein IWZ03DRAFT_70056 [Phyllosticta citriasiana]|uniref:Thioredoxin domain-containing protein n=1 Tax=Phyllosticta citriasiana TaxID=595635 RepID=A0ABR1KFE0_9PEZI
MMTPVRLSLSARPVLRLFFSRPRRSFSSSAPRLAASNANRIYTSVRNPDEFANLLLLSASSRRPLLTLWTASWCPSCQAVKPMLEELVGKEGVGEEQGGVGYAEVEVDAVTIGDLPITYRINSMPTLLAFDRQEAQFETRVTAVDKMKNRDFLRQWIVSEAKRRGQGGGGGAGILGKWFG